MSELSDIATMHETASFTFPKKPLVTPETFCNLFPFHMLFDRDLVISQCGVAVQRMFGVDVTEEPKMNEIFTIVHPRMICSFENILGFINASYVLEETATLDLTQPNPVSSTTSMQKKTGGCPFGGGGGSSGTLNNDAATSSQSTTSQYSDEELALRRKLFLKGKAALKGKLT